MIHLVYAHAYCVISAQDARNGDDGLFLPRDLGALKDANPIKWDKALHGRLSTRGWAFQEHQLSRRIVHFTTLRVLWECGVCVSYEDNPGQIYRALAAPTIQEKNNPVIAGLTFWRLFDGRHEGHDFVINAWQDPPPGGRSIKYRFPGYKNDILESPNINKQQRLQF
jgi:hypothetical protein